MFLGLDILMHIPPFNLYPTQRTMNIFSYYFLLMIDTAEEGDNEIRGAVSIIICRRSLVWTLKPLRPFSSVLNLTSSWPQELGHAKEEAGTLINLTFRMMIILVQGSCMYVL